MSDFKQYLKEERSVPAGVKIISKAMKELGEIQRVMGPDAPDSLRNAINMLDEAAKLLK